MGVGTPWMGSTLRERVRKVGFWVRREKKKHNKGKEEIREKEIIEIRG